MKKVVPVVLSLLGTVTVKTSPTVRVSPQSKKMRNKASPPLSGSVWEYLEAAVLTG